jgi:2-keto-4-pentenoate hydratase/2-oxohepta-3-ene-1,7-dioic acid hydratase in catechol pathway
MKIICIGRNYGEHAKELNNAVPEKPILFMKPQTALLKENKPFYLPDWSSDMHYETEVVLRVCKQGKYIEEKFAHKYVDEIHLGIDFTARDIQNQQKAKGLPWEIAKAFDNSAVLGGNPDAKHDGAVLLDRLQQGVSFHLLLNGKEVQKGNTADMIFSVPQIIAYASQFFTLQVGDLIYTGTPAGVGAVKIGDRLEGFLEGTKLFDFEVK